ncbi:MAG TPA: hypothetical protein VM266_04460, partial [Solirubrobacteraceae bacterium]|nr:hypothetical protein [Solirubrobacteraceae bacterium]
MSISLSRRASSGQSQVPVLFPALAMVVLSDGRGCRATGWCGIGRSADGAGDCRSGGRPGAVHQRREDDEAAEGRG